MSRWLSACVLIAGCGDGATAAAPAVPADTGTFDAGPSDASPSDDARADGGPVADSGPGDAGPETISTGPKGCITEIVAGTKVFSCDGLQFEVTVPAACLAGGGACGLVLDVHGMTMSARIEDKNTEMRALGSKYGYVVVQPNAIPAPPSSSWTPAVDDTKVLAFLKSAIEAYDVDRDRVHMTGFSQGGMMTSRFLCRQAELFASVAAAAGTGCTFVGLDVPSRELPVLYMHGTRDAVIAYSYGAAQRDAAVAAWKLGPESVVSADAKHRWTRRKSPAGTVFEFIQFEYEASSVLLRGHCFPGSNDLTATEPGQYLGFACTGDSAFVWGEIVMKFFRDHPRGK
ncbi:MAG: prolyl oligopeptidase family serine peptidase [Deltaproteobacteria bacterium]|nr:prolyl oligopeptidase family serine peptidase [Deltaproteobacteria bacterium]